MDSSVFVEFGEFSSCMGGRNALDVEIFLHVSGMHDYLTNLDVERKDVILYCMVSFQFSCTC